MTRFAIREHEDFPVFSIDPVDPGILAEYPDAGFEIDQALIDEYNQARDAWDAVQGKLGDLISAREQEGQK